LELKNLYDKTFMFLGINLKTKQVFSLRDR